MFYGMFDGMFDGMFEGIFEGMFDGMFDRFRDVKISWGYLERPTVVARLDAAGARRDADALKIDIDSFDADLLQAITI